jgi:chromosome partitioning protein
MPRTIAVSSQKGGIGKTTTTANLGLAWGQAGHHVLVVDLDPQFALTRHFGVSPATAPGTVCDLLVDGGAMADAVVPVGRGVDLLSARRELARLELALAGEHHREQFVAELLGDDALTYDIVVIDCAPSLGLLTVNAIVAADEVLVPVNMTDEGALQGAAEVRAIVAQLARHSAVRIRALVRTMADPRRIVYQRMNEALPELGLPIAQAEIPLRAAFQTAAAERIPLLDWRADSIAADAYRRLARELDDAGYSRAAA